MLQGVLVCRSEIWAMVINFIGAGFFTSSDRMSELAGLTGGYEKLINLYRVEESYHSIADEKSF
jgi:hypothetical protein